MDIRPIGEAEQMTPLAENRYGKSRVRVARVKRTPERHEFQEWTVQILLQGDFETCFTDGDNRQNTAHRYDEKYRVLAGADFVG